MSYGSGSRRSWSRSGQSSKWSGARAGRGRGPRLFPHRVATTEAADAFGGRSFAGLPAAGADARAALAGQAVAHGLKGIDVDVHRRRHRPRRRQVDLNVNVPASATVKMGSQPARGQRRKGSPARGGASIRVLITNARCRLHARVERHSHAECLLPRRSLGALQFLCNSTGGSLLAGHCLEFANLRGCPSAPL